MKNNIQAPFLGFLVVALFSITVLTDQTSGKTLPKHPLFGVTIENLDTFDVTRLGDLVKDKAVPLTVRVIFQREMLPSDYQGKLEEIKKMNPADGEKKIVVLATLYDSDFLARYRLKYPLKPENKLNCDKLDRESTDYQLRTFCFIERLDRFVDIWEVGNEVNGEWADEGCKKNKNDECKSKYDKKKDKHFPDSNVFPKRTIDKIEYAISLAVKKDKPVALTLLHQPQCTTWDDNDMFIWSRANITNYIRQNTDYLFVSYYEYNCNKGEGTQAEGYWEKSVFNTLNTLEYFPNANLGFGEVGYPSETISCMNGVSFCDKKTGQKAGEKGSLMDKYYGLKIATPKYIGGYFWWTFQQDIDCSAKENSNCQNFYNNTNTLFSRVRPE
jgi:hypothetical protein